jgi:hypothetical protein
MARHGLLIGVQDYEGERGMTPLSCPRADVDLMAQVLQDPDCTDEVYNVTPLLDPTYGDMTNGLDAFLNVVKRHDTVVIYFSGHGMRDDDGDLYLCMKDSKGDRLDLTALSFNRLAKNLQSKNLQRVLIILDCCYSGAAGLKDDVRSKLFEPEKVNPDGTGMFVLSSAGQAETSKEGDSHSIFTDVLVEGMRSGAADNDDDGRISVAEIAEYVATEVPKRATRQRPQISTKAASGTFVVAVNAARKRAADRAENAKIAAGWMAAGRMRLLDARRDNDVTLDFLHAVESWIEACNAPDMGDPKLLALRDYGDRSIGLMEFAKRWREKVSASLPVTPPAAVLAPMSEPSAPESVVVPEDPAPEILATKAPEAAPTETEPESAGKIGEFLIGVLILLAPIVFIGAVGYFWTSFLLHGTTVWTHAPSSLVPPPPYLDPELPPATAGDHWLGKFFFVGLMGFIFFIPVTLVVTFLVRLVLDDLGFIATALLVSILLLLGGLAYIYIAAPVPWSERFDAVYLFLYNDFTGPVPVAE